MTQPNEDRIRVQQGLLSDLSPKDKPWDLHRGEVMDVEAIYRTDSEFQRYAERLGGCTGYLFFQPVVDEATGHQLSLKLRKAYFCHLRHCPVCQWRRSLMWKARFLSFIPPVLEAYPTARWLFLTLTVRNVPISGLRETLDSLIQAWKRFIKLKEFLPVLGWVRTTEVTRGSDGSSHPHFHVLLMVPPSMASGVNYVKHSRWVSAWRHSARLNYDPSVDIRAVKAKNPASVSNEKNPGLAADFLRDAVSETLKYAVKPSDMVADPAWFLELTRQVHRRRFIATGGVLKEALRELEESDASLATLESESEDPDDGTRLAFNWREKERRYRRSPRLDRSI